MDSLKTVSLILDSPLSSTFVPFDFQEPGGGGGGCAGAGGGTPEDVSPATALNVPDATDFDQIVPLGELAQLSPDLMSPLSPSGGVVGGSGSGSGGSGSGFGHGHGSGTGMGSGGILLSGGLSGISLELKDLDVSRQVMPIYPRMAKFANISGDVLVEIVIDETGKPMQIDVLESPHDLLKREVLRVTPQWRFNPVKVNGIKTKANFRMLFRFTLV